MPSIMLDAGHFDHQNPSPCKTSPKYYESDMAWTLHLLLKLELQKYGFAVAVTRKDKDKDLPVYERGEMAKGFDLFLSIHSNAVSNAVTEGVDRPVIIYPVKGTSAVKSFANQIGKTVYDVMQTKQKYQIMTREYPGYPGYDYYGVLRGAVDVGCKDAYIIEHGFHTDTACTNWLLKQDNLQALAVAEAKLIAQRFGLTAPAPATGKTYRVQVGAYSSMSNAESMLAKLKTAGFTGAYIVSE